MCILGDILVGTLGFILWVCYLICAVFGLAILLIAIVFGVCLVLYGIYALLMWIKKKYKEYKNLKSKIK